MLLKRFTATTAAIATTLTMGFTTPTQAADGDDIAKLLFGVLAAGALATAINDSNRDTKVVNKKVVHHHNHGNRSRNHVSHNNRQAVRTHQVQRHAVTVTRPNVNLSVPAHCERRLYTQHGPRTYVGRPCLRRANYDVGRLPRNCRRDLDFGNRQVKAWGLHCLNKAGYRLK